MYEKIMLKDHNELYDQIDKMYDTYKKDFTRPWDLCNAVSSINHTNINDKLRDIFKDTALMDELYQRVKKYDDTYIQVWLNLYNNYTFQEPHTHEAEQPQCKTVLSFCYFYDVPDNDALFYFGDGHTDPIYVYEKTGEVLFFDPNEYHGVEINTTNSIRRTIAGNVVIKI